MEQFRQIGKRAINVGVDVQGFHPVSIEEIIKLADG
jgi:calcineurin-like phosphoesterase family protein